MLAPPRRSAVGTRVGSPPKPGSSMPGGCCRPNPSAGGGVPAASRTVRSASANSAIWSAHTPKSEDTAPRHWCGTSEAATSQGGRRRDAAEQRVVSSAGVQGRASGGS